MKYILKDASFKDVNGNVVNYTKAVICGVINEIPFEINIKPGEKSILSKQALKDGAEKGDLYIKKVNYKNDVYERPYVKVTDTFEFPVSISEEGIFVFKLWEKLLAAKK